MINNIVTTLLPARTQMTPNKAHQRDFQKLHVQCVQIKHSNYFQLCCEMGIQSSEKELQIEWLIQRMQNTYQFESLEYLNPRLAGESCQSNHCFLQMDARFPLKWVSKLKNNNSQDDTEAPTTTTYPNTAISMQSADQIRLGLSPSAESELQIDTIKEDEM